MGWFKVGDEGVYIGPTDKSYMPAPLSVGSVHVIKATEYAVGLEWVRVDECESWVTASSFRKVERKNDSLSIEAFLTIKPGFEEPKRTPAKKRERV